MSIITTVPAPGTVSRHLVECLSPDPPVIDPCILRALPPPGFQPSCLAYRALEKFSVDTVVFFHNYRNKNNNNDNSNSCRL